MQTKEPQFETWKLMYCPHCNSMVNTYKGVCGRCNKFVESKIDKFLRGFGLQSKR